MNTELMEQPQPMAVEQSNVQATVGEKADMQHGTLKIGPMKPKFEPLTPYEMSDMQHGSLKIGPMKPKFEPLIAYEMSGGGSEFRKVSVPAHRYTPLKKIWMEIYTPVSEQMKIDIRMNLQVL